MVAIHCNFKAMNYLCGMNNKECPYCKCNVTTEDYQCPNCGKTLLWLPYEEESSCVRPNKIHSGNQTDDRPDNEERL